MLIQADGNKHSLSSHFVDNHLEALYIQVYNKKKLQKTLKPQLPNRQEEAKELSWGCTNVLSATFAVLTLALSTTIRRGCMAEESLPEVSLKEKNPVNIFNRFEPETNASPSATKFHCIFCEKGFVDLSQLSAHETDTHEIPCKLCSTTCYTESDLKFHTEAAHKSIPEVLSPNPTCVNT